MKAAQARVRQAEAGLEALRDRIELEVAQRRDALEESTAALHVAEEQRTYARENLRVEEARFRHGQTTTTDLLQAQSYAVRAESDWVAERAKLERSYYALLIATGHDLSQELANADPSSR
jgi:outer membrane protein TolC